MSRFPIQRIVLYKHGVGYFEREGMVEGDETITLTFKQNEVSDVLKSLTVLDLHGGHISSVSYDSTKPLEQMLREVALQIPDSGSVVGLIPQIKGARVALHTGVSDPIEGCLLGVDTTEKQTGDGIVKVVLVSVLTDAGAVRSYDLHNLLSLQLQDESLKRDIDFYLRTTLSATKKDARTFTFFAEGDGQRKVRLSYTLEAPVWKATYRMIIGDNDEQSLIQGWAVVDNTQDEDWDDVQLSLIAGLPVSFVHDLYTPRYIQRPEVKVKESTGVLPPEMEQAMDYMICDEAEAQSLSAPPVAAKKMSLGRVQRMTPQLMASSAPVQIREQLIGDMLEYQIEHPVTIKRNQSALVPIVLKEFHGQSVLLYNKANRPENPMNAVDFHNTTGLTLEGGPITVLQQGSYVGEAMMETIKPDEKRLVPYAVELGVHVLDNIDSHEENVHRVIIRNGSLFTFRAKIQVTTFTFNNKNERDYECYLEQPRGGEWQLFETPEPVEVTKSYWRFQLHLPARKTTTFVVKLKLLTDYQHALLNMTQNHLGYWLEQKYFDAATAKKLQEVLEKRNQEMVLRGSMKTLEQERQGLFEGQQRIRENLNALGDRPSEKELRERYVKSLTKQEDRLEEITRELKELDYKVQQYVNEMNRLIQTLAYEADL